ncbi:MAG TPA: acetyl-CoA C-acetyltransferase [Candidatus Krumholzibacteria bacterium]|nr:acetyl-CoA C-acetyltransferase [Candidatus Krumholzibacteria bacterium]HPD71135.1 acetyl-CoA C-acetyltransferase [Candidatus Krumholzibacteria bacterium]HRY39165.1 acetyl-CoA C-acetyltransferase [Candidatus Krumholzibacteria bacterium]
MSKRVVICGGVRTPIGRFQGGLAPLRAPQLGAEAVKALLSRTGIDPAALDEVILGNVVQAGQHQNPARQAAIFGGVPAGVSAMTVNKVCGSGLKAVALAAQAIRAGDARCVLAGGFESMSNIPYALPQVRAGLRLGDGKVVDLLVHDGLWDVYNDYHMGMTAEWVVDTYRVSRADQDAFAAESHRRAVTAWAEGAFAREVAPVSIPQRRGDPLVVDRDEGPRADTTVESLGALRPAFKRDGGTVTAGNASTINDGAAALLVCDEEFARAHGLAVRAEITAYGTGAVQPNEVMMAPVTAVSRLLERTRTKIGDYDLYEVNEAFAAQAIAVSRELELDLERTNLRGGGVSLGHPIGCSGARILVTLLHALEDTGGEQGLATLCLGGGDAVALTIRRR